MSLGKVCEFMGKVHGERKWMWCTEEMVTLTGLTIGTEHYCTCVAFSAGFMFSYVYNLYRNFFVHLFNHLFMYLTALVVYVSADFPQG